MSNEIMQETTPLVECSAFHRGMSVLEASLRNAEDSEAIISGLLKGAAEFYGASRASVVEADWDLGIGVITVKAKLFCPEIAGLFCRIAGLFCHDSRANLSLKPVCFGIAIS